jgi:hypothetical protein
MSRTRVYRLIITYPPGSENGSGFRPYGWEDILSRLPYRARRKELKRGFRWPAERKFLSSNAAYRRAHLLEFYGAHVLVQASTPVSWDYGDQQGEYLAALEDCDLPVCVHCWPEYEAWMEMGGKMGREYMVKIREMCDRFHQDRDRS